MDYTTLKDLPLAFAFGAACLWWLNQNNLEFGKRYTALMQEFSEKYQAIIKQLFEERQQWIDGSREQYRQLMEMQRLSTDAENKVAHELHALRGTNTTLNLNIQQLLIRLGAKSERTPGGGSSDAAN